MTKKIDEKPVNIAESRIPGLDALRGLAAISVAINHYRLFYDIKLNFFILLPAYNGAAFFVELFFVLSGFLLTQVYSNIHSYSGLVIRRIARLFPLHWLTLLLVAVEQYYFTMAYGKPFIYNFNDAYHFFLNIFLIQETGLQTGFSFNAPSWSISVEWIINLIFFGLLMMHPRILLPSAIFIAIGCVGLLAISQPELTVLKLSFGFLDTGLLRAGFGFFAGVIAAKVMLNFPSNKIYGSLWDILAILLTILLIWFLASKSLNSQLILQIVVVGIIMPLLVIACSHGIIVSKIMSIEPLIWLGDISYSVYLMHFPVQILIWGFRHYLPIQLNSGEGLVCYVALVILISHTVFKYFERPSQKLLRRYLIQKPKIAGQITT
jgi:peptidoglycan/LPS O-acetylase OafA/YrhL